MPSDDNVAFHKAFRPISGWTLVLFAVVLAAGTAAFAWFLRSHPVGLIAILGLFYGLALVAVAVSVVPLGASALPALGIRGANWRYIVFGALGTVVLSVAVSRIGPEPEGMKQVIVLAQDPGNLLPSLLVFALFAPLVEELVFRGLLYGWIEKRWGSMVALVVSSLAFAGAHFEPAHILLVLPLGFLFGWLRRRSDSLIPSFAAHILNNGFAVGSAALLSS